MHSIDALGWSAVTDRVAQGLRLTSLERGCISACRLPIHSRSETARSSQLQERAILAITCLAAFLFFNSFGSIGVALPAIQKQFGNTLSEIQWVNLMGVVTIASLSFASGVPAHCLAGDGSTRAASCSMQQGQDWERDLYFVQQLILARAIMALGLAMALSMSTAILAASFDSKRRGQVLGLFASAIAWGA